MTPFHTRADWGARPPKSITRRTLTEDTAHYGGPSPWGDVDRSSPERFLATADHNRCASIWRAYQAFHMDSRGWSDIAYSSGVCPHGHRYEGRGIDVRTAANGTTAGNDTSHATCYIAGDDDPLTGPAKAAYIDEGTRLRGLVKGHRDWKPTSCPGDALYAWVHSDQSVPGEDMDLTPENLTAIANAVVGKLDQTATGFGQLTYGSTVKAILKTAQESINLNNKTLVAVGGIDEEVVAKLTTLSAQIAGSVADRIIPIIQEQLPAESMDPEQLRQLVRDEAEAAVRDVAADAATPDAATPN